MWIELPALTAEAAASEEVHLGRIRPRQCSSARTTTGLAWLIQKMLTKEGFAADVAAQYSGSAVPAEIAAIPR